jgi:hypothetical protein
MDLRRLAPLALLVPAAATAATLGPRWPHDQSIRYELGDAAPRVEEVEARWSPQEAKGDDDCAREVTFRYAPGRAPRTVPHAARLADGDYRVEIELRAGGRTAIVDRRVSLRGGVTSIDLASVVP